MQNDKSKCKIIFFGTSEFATPALKALVKAGYEISAVITQPDKPAGRKQILSPSPVKVTAQKLGLKIFQPSSLKIETLKNSLEISPPSANRRRSRGNSKLEIALGIIAAYGKIIPTWLLDIPQYGTLNIHPSLLPKYRGPSPIQTAILNGDKETGVTIMVVDEEVDHGPVITKHEVRIMNHEYYKDLEKKIAELGAELLVETLPKYIDGQIKPQEQDHRQATFTKMFSRKDGRISWNEPAEKIYNQIRALNPEPRTWSIWRDQVINITTCDVVYPQASCIGKEEPGTIKKIDKHIAVATKTCYLILKEIQLEGGKEMGVQSFINGHSDFLGSKLE